jgi:hypothetical protein
VETDMKSPERKRIPGQGGWRGRLLTACLLTACLLLPGLASAAPIDLPQLQQLDRGARQDLDSLQRGKTTMAPDQDPGKANTAATITPHERRQQLDQFTAQEANRREALRQQYRNKFDNRPAPMQRLDRIHRQRGYQLQQQRQLRQFRSERGLPPRTLR